MLADLKEKINIANNIENIEKRNNKLISIKNKINFNVYHLDEFHELLKIINNNIFDERIKNEFFQKAQEISKNCYFDTGRSGLFANLFSLIKDLKCSEDIKIWFLNNIIDNSSFKVVFLSDISGILSIENSVYSIHNEDIINKYLNILEKINFPEQKDIMYNGLSDLIDIKKIIIYASNFQNETIKTKYLNIANLFFDNNKFLKVYDSSVNSLMNFLQNMNDLSAIQDEQMRNRFLTMVNNVISRMEYLDGGRYVRGLKVYVRNTTDFINIIKIADSELLEIMSGNKTRIALKIDYKVQDKMDFIKILYNISIISEDRKAYRHLFLYYLIKYKKIDYDNYLMKINSNVIKSILYNIDDEYISKIVKKNYIAKDIVFYNNLQDDFFTFKKTLESSFYTMNLDNSILIQKISDAITNNSIEETINMLSLGELNSLREATYILDCNYNIFCSKIFYHTNCDGYLTCIDSLEEILNKYYKKSIGFFQKTFTKCYGECNMGHYFFNTIENVWSNKTRELTKEEIKSEIDNYNNLYNIKNLFISYYCVNNSRFNNFFNVLNSRYPCDELSTRLHDDKINDLFETIDICIFNRQRLLKNQNELLLIQEKLCKRKYINKKEQSINEELQKINATELEIIDTELHSKMIEFLEEFNDNGGKQIYENIKKFINKDEKICIVYADENYNEKSYSTEDYLKYILGNKVSNSFIENVNRKTKNNHEEHIL